MDHAPRTNDEAHSTPHAAGPLDQSTHPDSEAGCPSDQPRKEFETLRARAALRGFTLHMIEGREGVSDYLVARWNLSRTLPDFASVARFLDQAGVPHA